MPVSCRNQVSIQTWESFLQVGKLALSNLIKSLLLVASCSFVLTSPVNSADFAEVREKFYSGAYEDCIELTKEEVAKGIWNDFWSRQLIRTLLVKGEYQQAKTVYEEVSKKFTNSIPLRVMGAHAYRFCGQAEVGNQLLDEIPELVSNAPWRYSDRENLLAVGKYLLTQGEDARYILESCYDRILKADPEYVDAHIAIAELALNKADYQEAVKSLDRAFDLRPDDPEISFLLSKAWAPSDGEKAAAYLNAALDLNPRHVEGLLLKARELIDAEQYSAAESVLEQVLKINKSLPNAWALRAAISHLRGEYLDEGKRRSKALELWNANPEVDFLIGETLSKHYRFQEGVTYQRRALKLDPKFLPARFQLAQDLLRVGEDEEGWKIVEQVANFDKYNVVAYNLRTLQDEINKFETITTPEFIIRMDSREAKIYGARVVRLLTEAHRTLSEKYQFELKRPTTVEIFPEQSDFAIRTFGLPGGAGYLGVCFGSLITANSPASQGDTPSNWESVLWHEFCHVITLQKTNNRMPRWLSEGISVYEELQRDGAWGQSMTPRYKQMILGEDFVPLSKLSSAFMQPKSPMHLQFAYYESYLAVRYLVEKHGQPLLLKLLDDLGMGVSMAEAFARRFGDTAALDQDFEKYVKSMAKDFLPDTDFEMEELREQASPQQLEEWLADHPNNYVAQLQIVKGLIEAEYWEKALVEAQKLEQLYPTDSQPGGALDLLAFVARKLGDDDLERQSLEKILEHSSDNLPALKRLVAIAEEADDQEGLATFGNKLLAVQPLIPTGHEALVAATASAKEVADADLTIESLGALQEMDPLDPAELHFQVAQKLYVKDDLRAARLEALRALEFTPRYREAQKLLANIRAKLDGLEVPYPEEQQTVKASAGEPESTADQPELENSNNNEPTSADSADSSADPEQQSFPPPVVNPPQLVTPLPEKKARKLN